MGFLKNYRGRGWGFYCKNGVVIHIWGFSMEMEYRHCFSFVMVYGLSSNKVLYSTSNQFPYVNKNLLHFLNIKQQFSFMSWFLCLSRQKNVKNERMSRLLSIEVGFNPNLGELFRGSFWSGRGGGHCWCQHFLAKIVPLLKAIVRELC